MPTAIYARKSSESEERQVQSLGDQLHALAQLASREGYRVDEVFQEARSAKVPGGRPEFERLLRDIESGRITRLLTWSMSRLSRNPVDGGRIAYLLQTGRLEFIQTVERMYRPEDNALLLSIENGMATAYLQDLSRNVKRGMQSRAERGWHNGKAPVGYRNDAETRQVKRDPERFPLLQEAFRMYLSGEHSVASVHRYLVERGLTVRSRNGGSRPISEQWLYKVFKNPFYCGELRFNGRLYPGSHERMLAPEEFARLQRLLSRARLRSDTTPRHYGFAFANVLRCSACGAAVVGERKRKIYKTTGRVATYTYYHCSGSRGCSRQSVAEEELVSVFKEALDEFQMPGAVAAWCKSAFTRVVEQDSSNAARRSAEFTQKITVEQDRLVRLRDLRLDGELTAPEYLEAKAEIERRLDNYRMQRRRLSETDATLLQYVYDKLDRAVEAHELLGSDLDPHALGMIMPRLGDWCLNLKSPQFRPEPLVQKIASFEPLRNGSEIPERGDKSPSTLLWYAFVEELRKVAESEVVKLLTPTWEHEMRERTDSGGRKAGGARIDANPCQPNDAL